MSLLADVRSWALSPSRVYAALVAAAGIALLAGGCAGRNILAGGHAGARGVRDVALFPANIVVALPPGLETAAPFVDEEIGKYLDSHGKRVQALTHEEALSEWLASAQALKAEVGESQMSFEGAAATLARRMHAERRFDALVLPWIAIRPAQVRGRTVTWDGVTRTLRILNPQGRSLQVLRDLEARAAAPSLQLAVFSPDGRKLFEGVGGLDLVHLLVLEGEPTRIQAEPLSRSEIFADRTSVQEGVAVAFDPFLPMR